jgi:hypothetical protein
MFLTREAFKKLRGDTISSGVMLALMAGFWSWPWMMMDDPALGGPLGALIAICGLFCCLITWLAGFGSIYSDMDEYLGGSFENFLGLSLDGQRHSAKIRLTDLGTNLASAEELFPKDANQLVQEDAANRIGSLKREFTHAYDAFLEIGWIEDVGYGKFIPIPNKAA